MIDTSVLVAGLVENHEVHTQARPHVARAVTGQVAGIVIAESWAVLRREPFSLDAATVAESLSPWASADRIAPTPAEAYVSALRAGPSLHLGGTVHDLLIAHTCRAYDLPLVTLDRRQAALAATIPGLDVELLLP